MKDSSVSCINIGTDTKTSEEVIDLAMNNKNMLAIIGVHPCYVGKCDIESDFIKLREILDDKEKAKYVVGLGECGIDLFREEDKEREEIQRDVFRRHMEFAYEYDLALMIHCREAYDHVLDMLEEYQKEIGEELRVNFHFFAGTRDELERILSHSTWRVSFTGVITFAKEYEELVAFTPLDRLFSETDAPYVAPNKNRGKRNEPSYVIEVVEKIAEIKSLSVKEVAKQIDDNVNHFFTYSPKAEPPLGVIE